MKAAAAQPHAPLVALEDDVFLVRGSLRLQPLLRISRNMTVLRHAGELTLVNPMRLGEAGMAALAQLGRVRRLLSLGAMHGIDDAWYRAHFPGVEHWCRPGSRRYPAPAGHHRLAPDHLPPLPGLQLFSFDAATQPESALLLTTPVAGRGGLLLTCDSLQHYGDYAHHSLMAKAAMPLLGFPRTTVVGPIWLKEVSPPGGSLRPDFERLLRDWRFDRLIAAHGSYLPDGAQAKVAAAVARAFPA
jgi:hypothetical protein